MALRGSYNLDHPDAFDEKLLFKTLQDLLNGQTVKVKKKYIMNKNIFIFNFDLDCSL
jgi:uridine kinase